MEFTSERITHKRVSSFLRGAATLILAVILTLTTLTITVSANELESHVSEDNLVRTVDTREVIQTIEVDTSASTDNFVYEEVYEEVLEDHNLPVTGISQSPYGLIMAVSSVVIALYFVLTKKRKDDE